MNPRSSSLRTKRASTSCSTFSPAIFGFCAPSSVERCTGIDGGIKSAIEGQQRVLTTVFSDVGIADTQVLRENFQRRRFIRRLLDRHQTFSQRGHHFSNGSMVRAPVGAKLLIPP